MVGIRGKSKMPPQHPEDIKAAVRKAFGSLAELARQHDVSESVVQTAVSRLQPTGNRIIAAALGYKVHEIWPHLFDEAGNVRRSRPKNASRRSDLTHRQKAVAA